MIRHARADELPLLAAIEDAAAEMFRGTAMAFVLGLPKQAVKQPASIDPTVFLWAACTPDDQPIGFLEAELVGGWLHILELSVHPTAQRQGWARALLETAADEARARRLPLLSLTTDRHIAWNGPAYARMGFAELSRSAIPAWLQAILDHEARIGFDPARRIAMARRP